MMPELGFRAFLAGLVVIGGIEALQCWRDRDGLRLGDGWAQTQVIDGKVPIDLPQLAEVPEPTRAPARLYRDAREDST
jgi:hypothetical protein